MVKNKFKEGEQKSYNEKLMVIVLAFVTFLKTLLSKGKNCNPFSPIMLRGRPILLITRMITDRIGLHSVLLPLHI